MPVEGHPTQGPHFQRGWPWIYQVFDWSWDEPILLLDGINDGPMHSGALLGDLAVILLFVTVVTALAFWHRCRQGSWFRFSLRMLFALTALCAVTFGWWLRIHFDWQREQAVMSQWNQHNQRWAWMSCGPEWLRRLVPGNDPDDFKRITDFFVDDSERPNQNELESALQSLRFVRNLIYDSHSGPAIRVCNPSAYARVEDIWIPNPAQVDDETLESLGRLYNLKSLTIGDGFSDVVHISDRGLGQLANCHSLESLSIFHPGFTGVGFAKFAGLLNLHRLAIEDFQLTDEALAAILHLKSLDDLAFSNCKITSNRSLAVLAALPNLRSLSLHSAEIKDGDIEVLKELPIREELDLNYCENITDSAIDTINQIATLNTFHLDGCRKITDAGLRRLRETPRLKEIKISPEQFSNEAVKFLEQRISHVWVW